MKRTTLLSALVLLLSGFGISAFGQESGYQFNVQVEGIVKGREIQLAVFEGLNSVIKQKQSANDTGSVVFSGPDPLDQGYYYVVLPDQRFFQLMVEDDQHFSVKTDSANLVRLEFKGSPENEAQQVFVDESQKISEEWREIKPLRDAEEKDSKAWQKEQDKMDALNVKAKDLRAGYEEIHPNGLYTMLLKANAKVIPPLAPDSIEGEEDKNSWRYYYYKWNFWDNIDLKDERILRTAIFHERLKEFFMERTFQQVDSIKFWVDQFIPKLYESPKLYEYTVNYLANEYYTPKIMCLESVFVYIVDNYMGDDHCHWLSEAEKFRVRDRADQMRWSLCGEQGRNIIAKDMNGKVRNMYSIKSPLLLVFLYSAGCDHCKKETPKLMKLHSDKAPSGVLDLYSICTDDESADLKRYNKRFAVPWKMNVIDTTKQSLFYKKYHIGILPELYLLDPNRKIIAKKLNTSQMRKEIDKWMEENPNWREEYLKKEEK